MFFWRKRKPNYNKIDKILGSIFLELDINEAPIPLGSVCSKYFIDIYFFSPTNRITKDLLGYLKISNLNHFLYLNNRLGKKRQREVVAEILYDFLFRVKNKKTKTKEVIAISKNKEYNSSKQKLERDYFVNNLLAPVFLLQGKIQAYGNDVSLLSQIFDVSEAFMNQRLVYVFSSN